MSHLLVDLGWVDYDLAVAQPSCPATSAKFPSAQAELGRQCNTQNSSQPNPVHEQMGRPLQSSKNTLVWPKFGNKIAYQVLKVDIDSGLGVGNYISTNFRHYPFRGTSGCPTKRENS